MNFKIKLSKTNESAAEVTVKFAQNNNILYCESVSITNRTETVCFDQELKLAEEYVLQISRCEKELYSTNQTVHE